MKNTFLAVLFLLFLMPLTFSSDRVAKISFSHTVSAENSKEAPQNTKKPREDYISSFLLRNAKPLGLKENTFLRKFLSQPSIKWAMRSGGRHILN